MRYDVSESVLNNVLNYLAAKPYQEVVQLIASIHQDAKPIGKIEKIEDIE